MILRLRYGLELGTLLEKAHQNIGTMYETGQKSLADAVRASLDSAEGTGALSLVTINVVTTCNEDGTYQRNFRMGKKTQPNEVALQIGVDHRNKRLQIQKTTAPEEHKELGKITENLYNIKNGYRLQ